jgi:hypothetical protein
MLTTILICALGAVISALLGWKISSWFWSTEYSRTNTSGDGGGPRGGVFALAGGMMLSLMFVVYVGPLFLPSAVLGPLMLTVMIAGFAGGISPIFFIKRK